MPVASIICQNTIVEICDNAIDDDGDGLIDLNDDECNCPILSPKSLLPNSSFEQLDCCPIGHSTVACAGPWTQASETTPDLYHPCGYPAVNAPLPLPAGNGVIGIIDGVFTGSTRPNLKEYIGTCLDQPLLGGTIYRLQFYAGFLAATRSPPIDITMFGATDCNALPFGVGDLDFGCPSNDTSWANIGSVRADGVNEWRQFNTLITPNKDIYAVVIGPGCQLQSLSNDSYYYLDDLLLTKRDDATEEVEILSFGEPCISSFRLELPQIESRSYQWYRNGIALIGETEHSISYPLDDGLYYVRVVDADGSCHVTNPYKHIVPQRYTQYSDTFCEGEVFPFGNTLLRNEGIYFDTLQGANKCDSIVELELSLITEITSNQSIKILEGSSYGIGSQSYDTPGSYKIVIPSAQECDSTIHLELDFYKFYIPNIFSPNNDGNNDLFNISFEADIASIKEMNIYNRWGNPIYTQSDVISNNYRGWDGRNNSKPVNPGVYTYIAEVIMDDQSEITLSGMFTLIR